MKRIQKSILILIRQMALRWSHNRIYYWSERQLDGLRRVTLMPDWYYRGLFYCAMRLIHVRRLHRLADRAIHTIPYHLRIQMA